VNMKCKLKVGDRVYLNDWGLEQIFGSRKGLSHMKSKEMTITQVSGHSLTSPELTFSVDVDDVDINHFLIDDRCFDLVTL
jgi:hypothetical protein